MKVVAIIQARVNSTRLPNKVFLDLKGKVLLEHVVKRLNPSKKINEIAIATTVHKADDVIEKFCIQNELICFRGSENNVLERYYFSAVSMKADVIVRVTADDPFKDFRIIDEAIDILVKGNYDFVCNNNPATFPEGLDVEVVRLEALKRSYELAESNFQKEHVTQYIHQNKNKFKTFNIKSEVDLSEKRWTIDTIEDYKFVRSIYDNLYIDNEIFLTQEILTFLRKNPDLELMNLKVKRSEMYKK